MPLIRAEEKCQAQINSEVCQGYSPKSFMTTLFGESVGQELLHASTMESCKDCAVLEVCSGDPEFGE